MSNGCKKDEYIEFFKEDSGWSFFGQIVSLGRQNMATTNVELFSNVGCFVFKPLRVSLIE